MADNVIIFPPSYSLAVGLLKNQTVENVAPKELSQSRSSLDYAVNNGNTVSLVNGPLNTIRSTDPIETHKAWFIFNILYCHFCLGCIACPYSMKTKTLNKRSDIQGAIKASEQARDMNMATTVVGIIVFLFCFLYMHFPPKVSNASGARY